MTTRCAAVTCSWALVLLLPGAWLARAGGAVVEPLGPQAAAAAPAEERGGGPALPPPLSAAALEAHVRWLAHDDRAGRDTGTPELLDAAHYLARCFAAAGLEPGGDEGTFLQDTGWRGCALEDEPRLVLHHGDGSSTALQHGAHWAVLRGGPAAVQGPVTRVTDGEALAALPAVGEGRDASILLLDGEDFRATFGMLRALGQRDGVAPRVVLVADARGPRAPAPPPARLLGRAGQPLLLWVRGEALDALRAEPAATLEAQLAGGDPVPAVNVVGVLRGVGTAERPGLAQEAIVLSAHYDHVGVLDGDPGAPDGEPAGAQGPAAGSHGTAPAQDQREGATATAQDGDRIFNGADDDASGTALVVELARALGAGAPPARTLVFLAATGEERGLLGTESYVEQPVVPLEHTVANLNFEMVGAPDALGGGAGRLWLTGFERSNLGPAWQEAGLAIGADPRPEQGFFQRSDNIVFARRGIVAQTLSSGGEPHPWYHTVDDEVENLDFGHLATCAELAARALEPLAAGSLDPAWLPGGAP